MNPPEISSHPYFHRNLILPASTAQAWWYPQSTHDLRARGLAPSKLFSPRTLYYPPCLIRPRNSSSQLRSPFPFFSLNLPPLAPTWFLSKNCTSTTTPRGSRRMSRSTKGEVSEVHVHTLLYWFSTRFSEGDRRSLRSQAR